MIGPGEECRFKNLYSYCETLTRENTNRAKKIDSELTRF